MKILTTYLSFSSFGSFLYSRYIAKSNDGNNQYTVMDAIRNTSINSIHLYALRYEVINQGLES